MIRTKTNAKSQVYMKHHQIGNDIFRFGLRCVSLVGAGKALKPVFNTSELNLVSQWLQLDHF